eukprot:PhF_6_TR42921/c0_g1_i2/m.65074
MSAQMSDGEDEQPHDDKTKKEKSHKEKKSKKTSDGGEASDKKKKEKKEKKERKSSIGGPGDMSPTRAALFAQFAIPKDHMQQQEAPIEAPSWTDEEAEHVRSRLIRYYTLYNEEKVSSIDNIMDMYNGKTEDLFAALVQRYGPEPPSEDAAPIPPIMPPPITTAQVQPVEIEPATNTLIQTVEPVIQEGNPPPTEQPVEQTPGSTPSSQPIEAVDYRAKLIEFYTIHNPGKLSSVDDNLMAFKGNEEALFRMLRNTYVVGDTSRNRSDFRIRLSKFFTRYDPRRVSEIEGILRSSVTPEEEELTMKALVE